mgnify:CR=1 FL=1
MPGEGRGTIGQAAFQPGQRRRVRLSLFARLGKQPGHGLRQPVGHARHQLRAQAMLPLRLPDRLHQGLHLSLEAPEQGRIVTV